MIVLGIDPGKTGALAVYDAQECTLEIHDMPDTSEGVCGLIMGLANVRRAVIERPFTPGTIGTTNAFQIGRRYGVLMAALLMRGIPVEDVPPGKWKARFGLSSDKTASREKAGQLFPDHAHLFKRVKDHDRAEAALIAFWGSRK